MREALHQEAIYITKRKLAAGIPLKQDIIGGFVRLRTTATKRIPTYTDILAVLGVILGLHISHVHKVASDSVANHMAILYHVDRTRPFFVAHHSSEPVLAHGAHFMLESMTSKSTPEILGAWTRHGQMEAGNRGELWVVYF